MMIFPEQHKPKDYCRLYLLYASQGAKVIILRRGPSKWTQQIVWDTSNDTFTQGQWLHGTIKNYDCDVSPSGEYLIYFAQKYHSKDPLYETVTAVSKTPTFTALALWPLGDSWAGGGIFIDEKTLWLNHPVDKCVTHPDHPNTLFTLALFPQDYSKEKITPERYRMLREGWELVQEAERDPERTALPPKSPTQEEMTALLFNRDALGAYLEKERERSTKWQQVETFRKAEIWERNALHQPYTLIYKIEGYDWSSATYGEPTQEKFYLRNNTSGEEALLADVTHANFDHNGRLIMTRYGVLLACDLKEPLQARVLADFNDQKPPKNKSAD
jgi:hypothetical protein